VKARPSGAYPTDLPAPTQYATGIAADPPYPAYGLYAGRDVTAVVLGDPSDTIYTTMHVGDNNSSGCPPAPGCWTEIGWSLGGASGCVNQTGSYQQVFVYNAPGNAWWCGGTNFLIDPGEQIWVSIESSGAPGNSWYDYLWWSPYWYLVGQTTLATAYSSGPNSPNTNIEAYTNDSGNGPWMTIPQTNTDSVEVETQGIGGPWKMWDQSIPTGFWEPPESCPYSFTAAAMWYQWYGNGPVGAPACPQ